MKKAILFFLVITLFFSSCKIQQEPVIIHQTIVNNTQNQELNSGCKSDAECPAKIEISGRCWQHQTYVTYEEYKCRNPSTSQSYCEKVKYEVMEQICDTDATYCSNGKCLPYKNCTDTDNGRNYEKQGIVKDMWGNEKEDDCIDENTLLENYCDVYNKAVEERKKCSCLDGVCI